MLGTHHLHLFPSYSIDGPSLSANFGPFWLVEGYMGSASIPDLGVGDIGPPTFVPLCKR